MPPRWCFRLDWGFSDLFFMGARARQARVIGFRLCVMGYWRQLGGRGFIPRLFPASRNCRGIKPLPLRLRRTPLAPRLLVGAVEVPAELVALGAVRVTD